MSDGSVAPASGDERSTLESHRLVHELEVHRVELEMQNEELSRARTELEQALARYTDLYELAPVGYLTLGRDGAIRGVNLAGARLLGLERARLTGRRLRLLVAPEDGRRVDTLLARVFEVQVSVSGEFALPPGGATEFVELTAAPAETGEECRVVLSDITVRRRAEVAERASAHRYRALFERSRDALMTLAPPTWGFTSGNAAAVAMFGALDEADLVSRSLWDYAPPEQGDGPSSRERAREMIEATLREGSKSFDWTQRRLAGEEFPASVHLTRVDLEGKVLLHASVRDESERMRLLASAAQADRLASMGMLAAGVAHEINNPLTYVLFSLEALARDLPRLGGATQRCCLSLRERVGDAAFLELAGDGAELLEVALLDATATRARDAYSGAIRIRDVTAGLGAFSRVERDAPTAINLNRAVEAALQLTANEIKYRARLIKHLDEVPAIQASPGKLAQVFLNLLINAVHSIDEGAVDKNCITVRTWCNDDQVFAEVVDTGAGITAAMLPHVFEPFVTSKGGRRGSGLGLAICNQIITGFGGEIQIESKVGKGTRIVVSLPAAGAHLDERSRSTFPPPTAGLGLRGRILVVDDEPLIRASLARWLEKSHSVVLASSGAECQAILEHDTAFDIILCDLMMPSMTGMDLHEWLTTHDALLAAKVVFMTGGAFTPRAAEYLAKAGNPCLDKPFDFGELRRLITKRLRAAGRDAPPGAPSGD